MEENEIYLIPPYHRVKSQYAYRDISVSVYNDGEELLTTSHFFIKEIIGGYELRVGELPIEKPLGKLSYKLRAGNETIYDSKDRLYRNFIVFDDKGDELNNNKDYEGNAFVCYRSGDADLKCIFSSEYYNIGNVLVREGDGIKIGKEVFNFSSIAKPGVFGKMHTKTSVRSSSGEKEYPVYKEVDVVAFEADKSSSKFEIVINGKSKKLSDFQFETSEKEGAIKYVVELGLQKAGFYNIAVYQLNSGKRIEILKEVIVIDDELEYHTESVDNNTYRITVISALINDIIETEISAESFTPEYLPFNYHDKEYIYCIPLDLGFYHLSDIGWSSIAEDMWIGDVKPDSQLTLFDSTCDQLQVYSEEGALVEEIELKDKGCFREAPIQFLTSYKNNNTRVFLAFISDGKIKRGIYCYNKNVMDEEQTEIIFIDDPKQIQVIPVFHGKNKVFYEVIDSNGDILRKGKLLNSGESDVFDEFKSFQNYCFRFYESTGLLQLKKSAPLLELNRMFYAKDDYVGRTFKIEEVTYNQEKRGELIERTRFLDDAYVVFDSKEDRDTFLGRIYVNTVWGSWYLDKINPVKIELCSDVIEDTLDAYIEDAEYGEGLLFDPVKHWIINSLEHPTAPDIFIYALNLKGEA